MTAEIAILNRSALALAADSAVTISVAGKNKTYDTAEKLFELSRKQPIALMIYNNVEFVGVPLDVLIRKYRTENKDRPNYKTMKDAADEFLEYLRRFDHDVFEEEKYLLQMLHPRLRSVYTRANNHLRNKFNDFVKSEGQTPVPDPQDVLAQFLTEETALEKTRPLPGFLKKVTLAQFKKRFAPTVDRISGHVFKSIEITEAISTTSHELAYHLMKSSEGSEILTGLVFGGFAESDMFPTVRYIEIDGVFFDEMKVLSVNEVDIDRKTKRAEVVPFAQKEMVERFVYGLDLDLESDIKDFVAATLDEVLMTTTDVGQDKFRDSVKSKLVDRFDKMVDRLKETSRQDLLDIVYFMSKKELADIAYALVELTSQKRRFSTDEQTVGGPIDVAIITKNEGLVWIRRKHYFGSDVNQSYYSRVFGRGIGGGANDGTQAVHEQG